MSFSDHCAIGDFLTRTCLFSGWRGTTLLNLEQSTLGYKKDTRHYFGEVEMYKHSLCKASAAISLQ